MKSTLIKPMIRKCVCGKILGCKVDGINSKCTEHCHQCYVPKMTRYAVTTGICDECMQKARERRKK